MFIYIRYIYINTVIFRKIGDLDRFYGITAQFEEIVMYSDICTLKSFAPNFRDGCLRKIGFRFSLCRFCGIFAGIIFYLYACCVV